MQSVFEGSFFAMGTSVRLIGSYKDKEDFRKRLEMIRAEAVEWELRFSRFLPASELNAVNQSGGASIHVSSQFIEVLDSAIEGYVASEGRFDPSIAGALVAAGYDRSFDRLTLDHGNKGRRYKPDSHSQWPKMTDIVINRQSNCLRLPTGLTLDLGGIAKGAFVDRLITHPVDAVGEIIDAGGDLAAWGTPIDGDHWRIGIEHPGALGSDTAMLELPANRLLCAATSSTRKRQWRHDGQLQNHLIDPCTLVPIPAESPNVSVVADTLIDAEIATKSILVELARGNQSQLIRGHFAIVAFEDGHCETLLPSTFRAA